MNGELDERDIGFLCGVYQKLVSDEEFAQKNRFLAAFIVSQLMQSNVSLRLIVQGIRSFISRYDDVSCM